MLQRILVTTIISLITGIIPSMFTTTNYGCAVIYAQTSTPPEGSTAYYDTTIRKCFRQNNWNKGKSLLDVAIKKYPQMSAFYELMGKYYIHVAQQAEQNKKNAAYDKARYYLIRAITIDEKNVQARYHLLQVETETKHYSSAIVYVNDLLEENPYNEDLWRKKIDLYRKIENNAEADRLLERICTIYPNDEQLQKDLIERKVIKATKQRDLGDTQGQEQTLRQLIEIDAKNADHYRALSNLLHRTGRIAEAAEVAGRGAAVTSYPEFVQKRASMLCEMNRHREAVEYVKGFIKKTNSKSLTALLNELEMDAARAAQYNDSYVAYAKIYETQHSIEALDYLVNTSIERWYLDDALIYIEESLKRKGKTPKMLYNQYLINKRLGNTRKANALLMSLYERYPHDEAIAEEAMLHLLDTAIELMELNLQTDAIPILEKVFYSDTYAYIKDAAFQRLYNCYFQSKQYIKAERMLANMQGVKRITQTASLYNAWGKPQRALDFLSDAFRDCNESEVDTRNLISYSYEEIAIPYIKDLLSNNRVTEANKQVKQALEICPSNIDLLRYGITAAQRKGDSESVVTYITNGRRLYPKDPYFILKEAQIRHIAGDHQATIDQIIPLLEEYEGDPLLISLYTESCLEIAKENLKQKKTDQALRLIDAALQIAADDSELYYYQAIAYEQKKDWGNALNSYKKYKPNYADIAEHKHHIEEICHHTLRNSLSLEYQQARPGSEDIISGNAYVNYERKLTSRNTLYTGIAYAGRDGTTGSKDTEVTRGGTGVQISAGFQHDFSARFSGKIEAAYATRYFPIIMAKLSGSYALPKQWTLSAFASYRMLRSFTGTYDWQSPIVGYNSTTNKPIYGEPEYVLTGWEESKKSMIQLGAIVNKTIAQFELSGELSGIYFSKNLYFNSNVKMQFFPVEGNSSKIFAVAGLGTAPESSLIDRSLPVGFDKINTFVGLGGSYFVNRWITLALSGTWYTILAQSERLSTNYIVNTPTIRQDFRNYFYIHGSVQISF